MTGTALLYGLAGVGLFSLGLYGVLAVEDRIRRVLAVNVMGTGVFMVLIALAARTADATPDPVLHAMVLTGIVVAVSATGLAVALACGLGDDDDGDRSPSGRTPGADGS
jgi:multicomponent Na+:H+ antiporter subunit C